MSLNPDTLKNLLSEAAISETDVAALGELINEAILAEKVAIATANDEKIAALTEAHDAALAAASELNEAKLTEAVDHAVETFVAENEPRFVMTENFQKMESVFAAVKGAFESAGIALNESADEAHAAALNEAAADYDELLERFMELKESKEAVESELELAKRSILFEAASKDLTETQRERVGKLVENVDFSNTSEFAAGLKLIVEMEQGKEKKDEKDEGKEGSDEDEDDKVDGSKAKGKSDLKESRIDPKAGLPLYQLTPEERMARYTRA